MTIARWRMLFWAALAFAFVMAVLPHPPRIPGQPSDKIQHIVAFTTLGALACQSFPRAAAWRVLLGLSLYGALIELVQLFPALNRDGDVIDWLADTAAVAVVLGLFRLARR